MTTTIPPAYQGIVESIARMLQEHPELRIESTIQETETEINEEAEQVTA